MNKNFQIFDSFNARHSSYEEIAQTFVSNEDFFEIVKNNHTFILGPRGCGKTTMFKMLTASAQYYWNPLNPNELRLKETLPFIAIYIPSDELWKDQLRKVIGPIESDKELLNFITNALITLNVLSNFCSNIQNYIEINCNRNIENEYKFCLKLIKIWKLNNCVADLHDINLSLSLRKDNLLNKLKSHILNKKYGNIKELEFEEFYHTDFLDALRNGLNSFEDVFFNGKRTKWAICFDELELVSKSFIKLLVSKLRTTPANIVFKLSSGPLTEFENSIAQVFHDFEIVKMWPFSYTEEERYMKFCEEIAKKRISNFINKNSVPTQTTNFESLFGKINYKNSLKTEFDFEVKDVKENEEYSLTWFAFKELAKRDKTFYSVLISRGIDPKNPIPISEIMSSSFHRKVKEIVINRLIFNKYKDGKYDGQKSRKEYLIYHGKESILRVCEGNPRFIINIMNELFNEIEDIGKLEFSSDLQAKVIKNVSSRFNAMLNTYPTTISINGQSIDLKWLIQKIGTYFQNEVNIGPFKVNPANSFLVKSETIKPAILKLIHFGVGLGAFIKIDKTSDDIVIDNHTTRFRISYLLNPEFKLPLRLYSSIKLNSIIQYNNTSNNNPNLFD
jgi:energy-coupling factor transporter ATP-binding protein EcfA2